jgi:hypothetical protein
MRNSHTGGAPGAREGSPSPATPRDDLTRLEALLPWFVFAPYLGYLMIKYRSPTLFTAANPGIASGGVVGESKSRSLRHLLAVEDAVADFIVVDATDAATASTQVHAWRREHDIDYPVVAKPDVGERGWGVEIMESHGELERYLTAAEHMVIVQRHVRGIEYGIFYCRHPDEPSGRIVSIAEVRYRTLGAAKSGASLRCESRTFRDCRQLATAALTARIETLARSHPGFFVGRFDVIARNPNALRAGACRVIEVNGVMAEAVHLYDPVMRLADKLHMLAWIWNRAFEIGDVNRERGAKPMGKAKLARLLLAKFLTQSDLMAALPLYRLARRIAGPS